MTATENRPSLSEEVEARTQVIYDQWIEKDSAERRERARRIARRQVQNERLAVLHADPAYWVLPMAKAGVIGLAQTWEGCPVPPDSCIVPDGFWSIEADGVYVTPEGQARQKVVSPIVETSDGSYAALVGGKWKLVPRPATDQKDRLSPRTYAALVMRALQSAGVEFGGEIVAGVRSDDLDRQPASAYAARWLLGIDPGVDAICGSPVRSLRNLRPEDGRPDTTEGRQQLGEVLTRQPRDIGHRR